MMAFALLLRLQENVGPLNRGKTHRNIFAACRLNVKHKDV